MEHSGEDTNKLAAATASEGAAPPGAAVPGGVHALQERSFVGDLGSLPRAVAAAAYRRIP